MKPTELQVHEIDPNRVRVFVHRERDADGHAGIVADIRRNGQTEPGEVREIDDPKFDYGLIVGEGRLMAAKKLKRPFLAYIIPRTDGDTARRFLDENMRRERLPWMLMAKLIQPELAAGVSAEVLAQKHSLSIGHVQKLKRIIDKTGEDVEDDVAFMTMNDAEVFTALPAKHQSIVMQVFKERPELAIQDLVAKARTVAKKSNGKLSEMNLRASIQAVEDELRDFKARMKPLRVHFDIGPTNLLLLMEDPAMAAALKRRKINLTKFQAASER